MSDSLSLLIRSGNPLIWIDSIDEERAMERVSEAAAELKMRTLQWSLTGGLCRFRRGALYESVTTEKKIGDALTFITDEEGELAREEKRQVYVLLDSGAHCSSATVYRQFRDLLPILRERRTSIILIESRPLPEPIRRFTTRYDLGWPSSEELEDCIRSTVKRIRDENETGIKIKLTKRDLEHIVLCLRGLTCTEAERVAAAAVFDDFAFTVEDIPRLIESKRTLLGSAGCLEAISVDFQPEDVGGLNRLKQWLGQRRGGFTKEARKYGLESPRGVLMLGVPGCGKSLCAKVVAADWKMLVNSGKIRDPGVMQPLSREVRAACGTPEDPLAPGGQWITRPQFPELEDGP